MRHKKYMDEYEDYLKRLKEQAPWLKPYTYEEYLERALDRTDREVEMQAARIKQIREIVL